MSGSRSCLATPIPSGGAYRIPIEGAPWGTIVGVVGHIRHDRVDEDAQQIYFPFEQRAQDRMALVVRTRNDASAIGAALTGAIRSVDPEQPVYDARTLSAVIDRALGQRWLQTALTSFACIAVVLASIGVYGVIAYAVGQRRREFGIRLALGARRGEIVAGVLRRGVVLFVAGSAAGLAGAAASARVMRSLLFNVSSFDVVSFAAATAILFIVALVACALPARRAAGVDPSVALRTSRWRTRSHPPVHVFGPGALPRPTISRHEDPRVLLPGRSCSSCSCSPSRSHAQRRGAAQPEGLAFRFLGPTVGNRVASIAGVPGDPSIYYAGAASGGVWKTTDGGIRWVPVSDSMRVTAIGALAVAPSDPNVVWAGTG